jgi:undecaprenyl-diphosphatase
MAAISGTRTERRRKALYEALWLSLTVVVGQITLAALAAAVALWLFVFLADVVAAGATQRFDSAVIDYFQGHQTVTLRAWMLTASWFANGPTVLWVVFGTTLVLLVARRFWPDAGVVLLCGLGGWAFIEVVKKIAERERPPVAYDAIGYSFPSGHAFFSVAIYGLLAYYASVYFAPKYRRLIWASAAVLILMVGSSRFLLGVHYPSDVLAGFMAGSVWLWLCLALRPLLTPRDWVAWREERIKRLTTAHLALDRVAPKRAALEASAQQVLQDRKVPGYEKLLVWICWHLAKIYKAAGRRWKGLERYHYDLLALGWALDRVRRRNHRPEVEDLREELVLLKRARRGVLGMVEKEPPAVTSR